MDRSPSGGNVKTICLSIVCLLCVACPRPIGNASKSSQRSFKFESNKDTSAVLAKVGNTQVTVAQIQKLLNKQSPYVRAEYKNDSAALDKFIEGQIRYALLAEKGIALGYQSDPEVMDAAKKLIVQKLTRDVFDNQVKLSDVTTAEIEAFYQANIDDYLKPEMIRLSHLLIGFGKDKSKARQKITDLLKEASDPKKLSSRAHFRTLVQNHSEEESTKKSGGDMRYRSKSELENLLGSSAAKKAWALPNVNDVSGVVESKIGFHIFKKLGERAPTNRKLSEVRAQVKNRVYRQKRKEAFNIYLDGLKNEIGVTLDEDKKKLLQLETPAARDPHDHMQRGKGHPEKAH